MSPFHHRKKRSEYLPHAIFTREEMERLTYFRQHFVRGESDTLPPTPEQQRLTFARWLFVTGKLTDDISPPKAWFEPM